MQENWMIYGATGYTGSLIATRADALPPAPPQDAVALITGWVPAPGSVPSTVPAAAVLAVLPDRE